MISNAIKSIFFYVINFPSSMTFLDPSVIPYLVSISIYTDNMLTTAKTKQKQKQNTLFCVITLYFLSPLFA